MRRPLDVLCLVLLAALLVPWVLRDAGRPAPLPAAPAGGDARGETIPATRAVRLLRRHVPVLHLDRRERTPPSDARGDLARVRAGQDPLGGGPVVVHGRAVKDDDGRTWLQYWLFYADNPQDRGVLRTGRHRGDWEVVQLALDRRSVPRAMTLGQHAWAAGCRARREVHVHVAHASHASYPRAGTHGRPWPDPDDEAPGDGRVVRPVVELVAERDLWVRYDGRWGATRRGPVPGEQSSPVGPAHQDDRGWDDPAAFHRGARGCAAGAPRGPFAPLAAGAVGLAWLVGRRRVRVGVQK